MRHSATPENVLLLQIWIIGQDVIDAVTSTDLTHDDTDSYAHPADARFSAHLIRLSGNPSWSYSSEHTGMTLACHRWKYLC